MLTRLPSTRNPNYWLIYWLIVSQLLCEEILITVFSFLCLWQIPDEFDRGECEHTNVTDGYLFRTSLCFHNVWRQISCSPLLKLLFKCLFRVWARLVLFASLCLISIFLISPGCRDVSSVTGCCRLLCFEFPRVLENLENSFQSWKIWKTVYHFSSPGKSCVYLEHYLNSPNYSLQSGVSSRLYSVIKS